MKTLNFTFLILRQVNYMFDIKFKISLFNWKKICSNIRFETVYLHGLIQPYMWSIPQSICRVNGDKKKIVKHFDF